MFVIFWRVLSNKGRVYKCFIMFWHIDCPVRVVCTDVCHLYMVCGGKLYSFKNFGMVAISVLKFHLWLQITKVFKHSDTKFGFKCISYGVQKQRKSLSLNCFSSGSHWHQAAYLWRCLLLKIATYDMEVTERNSMYQPCAHCWWTASFPF